jgi:hypothetical protein
MSKSPPRQSSHVPNEALPCAEKLAFDERQAAADAANVARYQRGMKLHVYRCRYCSLWHLSSRPDDND